MIVKMEIFESHKYDFGEWPFNVFRGCVEIENNGVFFINDGKKYAVNGQAMAMGGIEIKPIWKKDSKNDMLWVNLGPFIRWGLKLEEEVIEWRKKNPAEVFGVKNFS